MEQPGHIKVLHLFTTKFMCMGRSLHCGVTLCVGSFESYDFRKKEDWRANEGLEHCNIIGFFRFCLVVQVDWRKGYALEEGENGFCSLINGKVFGLDSFPIPVCNLFCILVQVHGCREKDVSMFPANVTNAMRSKGKVLMSRIKAPFRPFQVLSLRAVKALQALLPLPNYPHRPRKKRVNSRS